TVSSTTTSSILHPLPFLLLHVPILPLLHHLSLFSCLPLFGCLPLFLRIAAHPLEETQARDQEEELGQSERGSHAGQRGGVQHGAHAWGVLVPLLLTNGFSVEALLGRTRGEAEQLAAKVRVPFSSSSCMGGVPLHQLGDLMRIFNPPELSCGIAVKALGSAPTREWSSPGCCLCCDCLGPVERTASGLPPSNPAVSLPHCHPTQQTHRHCYLIHQTQTPILSQTMASPILC
ncbi:uncharacterized protein LOC133339408, partial [Lethenteron reissneri]|uniref:uncharacterized protein LOC133339408 n=1 Tax=Lethenteron reissneri TaxID=7753 RepID=UPI002AB70DB4